jgi:hypothetical protein
MKHGRLVFHFGVVVATAIVVGLTYHIPDQRELLRELTRESSLYESATAVVLALSAVYVLSVLARRSTYTLARWQRRFLVFIGALLVLAALEEISWGQHFFGFSPPEFFLRHNRQREVNLHNLVRFATLSRPFIGALLVFFIVMPLYDKLRRPTWLRRVRPLLPSLFVTLIFLYAVTINHYRIENPIEYGAYALFIVGFGAAAYLAFLAPEHRHPLHMAHFLLITVSALVFIAHREVLGFRNLQYEIMEFVLVYAFAFWLIDWVEATHTGKMSLADVAS